MRHFVPGSALSPRLASIRLVSIPNRPRFRFRFRFRLWPRLSSPEPHRAPETYLLNRRFAAYPSHQLLLDGHADELGGVVGAEFGLEVFSVASDRFVAEVHPVGYFTAGVARRQKIQQFALLSGERMYRNVSTSLSYYCLREVIDYIPL